MRDDGSDARLDPGTSPFDLFPRERPPGDPEERRGATIGISLWIVAALCLVAGILVGFASGYTAGRRAETILSTPAAGSDAPDEAGGRNEPGASVTSTDGTVRQPQRVDPPPIVTSQEPPAAPAPAERPAPPAPAPAARPRTQAPVAAAPSGEGRTPAAPAAAAPPPSGGARAPASAAAAPAAAADAAGETRTATGNAGTPTPEPTPTAPAAGQNAPPAVASATAGSMQVLSRPAGANVIVDGQLIGQTPLLLPGVTAGAHDVRLELEGFRPWATSVEIRPGVRARVAASLEQ